MPGAGPGQTAAAIWQLMPLAALPEPLDRAELWLNDGAAGLRPLPGVRWAEPLRDALPRLLLADLLRWRGVGSVWAAPLPPGLPVQQQLRVQLLALDNLPAGSEVRLQARWSLADAQGRQRPQTGQAELRQPWPGGADALVLAQRRLFWQLAGRLAQSRLPTG